ncbi:MAG: Maf family protein [Proteobacteria bacterium]|nr:Maf family protein [Pseudomonadota bacterium]
MTRPLILASASKSRANVMRAAGLSFEQIPAYVDEDAIKAAMKAEGATAADCALALAEFKAGTISMRYPEALVIGADQMLDCDGDWFDKPKDIDGARSHLLKLRGKTHVLPTSVTVALHGAPIWHHTSLPRMSVRPFSDTFLEEYVAAVGDALTSSVGAYHLEGRGAQIFSKVEGDFFSVLGLPLLELLAFLREHRVVTS